MSADDGPTERALSRSAGRLRGLAAALGVGATATLAGCNSQSEAASGGGTTPDESSGAGTPRSPAECREDAESLQTELDTVNERAAELEAALPRLRRRERNVTEVATLFEPAPEDVLADAEAVGAAARDAVVFLEFPNGLATGWCVDEHHIVTNAHNVAPYGGGEPREATAWTYAGEQVETTTVDYVSSFQPDVAVLRTTASAPATLSLGSTSGIASGDYLVQVGHPGGVGNWLTSVGRLNELQEIGTPGGATFQELETTVPGRQGVSGSPLLTLDGDVVGLTYAGSPIRDKQADEPPLVAPDVAYDRPLAALSYGTHVAIEDVLSYYEDWTQ